MKRILVLGQTPPPFHGQAIMIQEMLNHSYNEIELIHVRMKFSDNVNQVGRVQLAKIWKLFIFIAQVVYKRIRHKTTILYFPPAGAKMVPMLRDLCILLSIRWMFSKTIFHFHAGGLGNAVGSSSPILKSLFQKAYFYPDLAIRISNHTPPDNTLVKAKKSLVIHNGILDIKPLSFHRKYSSTHTPIILYLGIISEEKGVFDFIEATEILAREKIPFQAALGGCFSSCETKQKIEDICVKMGLTDYIAFLGEVSGKEKINWLEKAAIYCSPSHVETFGLSIVEAMCMELPIVATQSGGVAEIMAKDDTGLLVPVKTPRAIAAALKRLLKNEDLRKNLGQNARRKYLTCYTRSIFTANIEKGFNLLT